MFQLLSVSKLAATYTYGEYAMQVVQLPDPVRAIVFCHASCAQGTELWAALRMAGLMVG